MIRRKTNRRHMTGDHHGPTARRATLLVTATDEILGTHRSYYAQVEHARQAISVDRAFALANVLGVEMTELFTAFPAVPHARPY